MSNVTPFPHTHPVEIADAERAARLDRIIADLDALSEDTRQARGGMRYEVKYIEVED